MILKHRIPLLQNDLLRACPDLCGDELLEVADRVVGVAFDADFLAEAVVTVGGEGEVKYGGVSGGRGWGWYQMTSIMVGGQVQDGGRWCFRWELSLGVVVGSCCCGSFCGWKYKKW